MQCTIALLLTSAVPVVNVTLDYATDDWLYDRLIGPLQLGMTQLCTNLLPGQCCQGRQFTHVVFGSIGGPHNENYRKAYFEGLAPLDVATLWQRSARNGPYDGCSGMSLATATGPGEWIQPPGLFEGSEVTISGASNIRMPVTQPTNREAPWLQAQGIFGLVTEKWIWTAGPVN